MKKTVKLEWLKKIYSMAFLNSKADTLLIKAKFHRDITGEIKTFTVSMEANQFFVSMNIEVGTEQVYGTNNGKSIGIDVGIKIFTYTSENRVIKHIDERKEIANVIKAQKVLSRRKKGSKNSSKAKNKTCKKTFKTQKQMK